VRRLVLLRHAPTAATRRAAFPVDEPLDARGAAAAAALRGRLPAHDDCYAGPSLRARETARLAGLAPRDEPALAECDFGAWSGRALAEVAEEDPEGLAAWMSDPAATPHGGESLTALAERVARWLDGQAAREGAALAVTSGGPIRAAVVHALGAPPEALWRIEAAPLGMAELHCHDGSWRVIRLNVAAPAGRP
jgi:broad specificity phosphatase PhoE